jgi:hypothetical protein
MNVEQSAIAARAGRIGARNFKHRSTVFWAAISSLVTGLLVYAILSVAHVEFERSNADGRQMSACFDSYRQAIKPQNISFDDMYKINGYCYTALGSQLLIDEEVIRRDTFVFQRHENVVLLFMVVAITLSGVALAGLQLLASYKLAARGHGELAGGGEISYSPSQISFKSSVVGLMILAISFAFFMIFVIYVYTLTEGGAGSSKPGLDLSQIQTQRAPLPAPNPSPIPAGGIGQLAPAQDGNAVLPLMPAPSPGQN